MLIVEGVDVLDRAVADTCVVGSGPVGSALAIGLARQGHSVVVLRVRLTQARSGSGPFRSRDRGAQLPRRYDACCVPGCRGNIVALGVADAFRLIPWTSSPGNTSEATAG